MKEHSYITEDDLKYHGKDFIGLYFKNLNTLRQLVHKSYGNSEMEAYISSPVNKRGDSSLADLVEMALSVLQNAQPVQLQQTQSPKGVIEPKTVATKEDSQTETASQQKVRWSKEDKQNKRYVISMIGYDPFENSSMTEADSKYCFNILSGYCDTDGISEDGHKLQCVIQITTSLLQCKKIDDMLNHELLKSKPDEKTIQALSSSKKTIQDSINNLAKDNNISSKYSKNSKPGQNTLTAKMRQMAEDGFQSIAVNLYDIKTCEAFKQIQDLSNQSIAEQLMFDSNEYTDIIKEQRDMIQHFEREIDDLREENRNLKNKLIALEGNAEK